MLSITQSPVDSAGLPANQTSGATGIHFSRRRMTTHKLSPNSIWRICLLLLCLLSLASTLYSLWIFQQFKPDMIAGVPVSGLVYPPFAADLSGKWLHWLNGYGQPLSNVLLLAVGALIGWRGGSFAHLRHLALGMLCWSLLLPFYVEIPLLPWLTPLGYCIQLSLPFFLAFVLNAPEWQPTAPLPSIRLLRRALVLYFLLCLAGIAFQYLVHSHDGFKTASEAIHLSLTLLGYAALVTALFLYRAHSHGMARERLDLLLPLFGLTLIVHIQPGMYYFFPATNNPWVVGFEYLMSMLLPLALTYAILRHRVIDLGYALNRTFVFSLSTLTLAVLFGTLEFKLKSAMYEYFGDLGNLVTLALGISIILGFRHIHHWVEHTISHLFFHDWELAANRLRQHMARIARINESEVAITRFAETLQEFTPMKSLAFYVQEEAPADPLPGVAAACRDQLLRCPAAGYPARLDYNHPLLSELRCGTRILESEEFADLAKALPFRLALPLRVRGRVLGIVLLGQKNNEHRYRPDQITLLQQACDEMALDLENLRMEQLQREHQQYQQQVAMLQAQLQIVRPEVRQHTPA
jgi:hypothetical protein